jgi:hypothetical protein
MEPTAKGWSTTKDDWRWNLAKALVDRYDLIAYEDLRVSNMVRNHGLARAIQDASCRVSGIRSSGRRSGRAL